MKTLNVAFGVCALIVHLRYHNSLFTKLSILNLQCNSYGSLLLEPDDVRPQPVHGGHPPLCLHTGETSCGREHHFYRLVFEPI